MPEAAAFLEGFFHLRVRVEHAHGDEELDGVEEVSGGADRRESAFGS